MKLLGKSRGHMQPRKQSRRLPACLVKHNTPVYDKKRIQNIQAKRAAS
jgi:hypothetical protein